MASVAPPSRPWVRWSVLSLLGFLTCGLTLFDRGLYQDDVLGLLNGVVARSAPWWQRLHPPREGPTRLLGLVPYSLACATPAPLVTLQLLLLATWIGLAALTANLATRLAPRLPGVGMCAGILVATASSDFLTGSLVGLGYQLAVTLFVGAAVGALAYVARGRAAALVVSCVLLVWCQWTIDVAALSFPLVALALLATRDSARRRRAWAVVVAWLAVSLPYLLAFWAFLHGAYAHVALRGGNAASPVELLAHNFLPWRWAFRRPWFPPPPALIALPWKAALATPATLMALWAWRRERHDSAAALEDVLPRRAALSLLVLLLLVANVPMARVQLAQVHYRTHVLSRIWASLLLAMAACWLLQRPRAVMRASGVAGVALFTFFGIWGGLERQDSFLGAWLVHRRELVSLVTAVPTLPPHSALLLDVPLHSSYMATEAEYIARSWAALLYEPAFGRRTYLLSPRRGTGCRVEPVGLQCWGEAGPRCAATGACAGALLPYANLLVAGYDVTRGEFARQPSVPPAALGVATTLPAVDEQALPLPSAGLIRWRRQLLVEPWTPWARAFSAIAEHRTRQIVEGAGSEALSSRAAGRAG